MIYTFDVRSLYMLKNRQTIVTEEHTLLPTKHMDNPFQPEAKPGRQGQDIAWLYKWLLSSPFRSFYSSSYAYPMKRSQRTEGCTPALLPAVLKQQEGFASALQNQGK